jgi:hypothetical protein
MSSWIYRRDGDLFTPGKWSVGPWSTELQHGGPAAALFVLAAEKVAAETGLQLVRLTTELFRPIPRVPLALETRDVRRGRRIAALEMSLRSPEEPHVLCRAAVLLLRAAPDAAPQFDTPEQPPPAPAEEEAVTLLSEDMAKQRPEGFHSSIRLCSGNDAHGAYAWLRTDLDLVAGLPTTTLQRFTALADTSFGLSGRLHMLQHGGERSAHMINADSTLYWEREPVGEWLGVRPQLLTERAGIGVAEVALYDAQGRVGRCTQAAILNLRPRFLGPDHEPRAG